MTHRQDGAALLTEVRTALRRYLVLPNEHTEVAVTLWIAATHAGPWLNTFPRLAIRSPEKRCGKTRLLDLIGVMGHRPISTANMSSAVLYRIMGGDDPRTLILDEADTVWGTKKQAEANEDLRGLINAGFERGRPTLRYNAAKGMVEELETFGFAALAGIGALPDTITDRSVNVVMRRRQVGETVAPFRSQRDGDPLRKLGAQVAVWVASRQRDVAGARPEMPVEDRAADVWEPLVIVGDLAGPPWSELARAAAKALTHEQAEEDQDGSDSLRLLGDIKAVFSVAYAPFLASRELVQRLRSLDESPWNDYDLTVQRLSGRLRHYGVKPTSTGTVRGYRLEQFTDAFSRYLAPEPSEVVKTSDSQLRGTDGTDDLTTQVVRSSTGASP